jgi:surfeit locus 1 family protein
MMQGRWSWTRVLVLLAALVGMTVTASLGRWQLGRAAQKQAIAQARHDQAALPELDGRTLTQIGQSTLERDALLYRRLALKGVWLTGHTVYLDNRQMHGRPGFYVVTPLRLQDSDAVVLVQRGWVPRNFQDRTALPVIDTADGPVMLQGQLVPWPSKVYDFGEVETGAIRQNLVFEDYRLQTRLPLLELSIQQTDADSEGLQRAWPEIASGVEKHYGYAFQWFGLGGLIALLYVWFQIVQPRRKKHAR